MIEDIAYAITSLVLPFTFIFSIYFKIWKDCPVGFIVVSLFASLLGLKALNIVPDDKWVATHLFVISFISILVMCYIVWINFKKYCKKDKE